jgi:pentatricopeptide repeat protein
MIVEIGQIEKHCNVLSKHTESSWNALISWLARCNKQRLAISLYHQMMNKEKTREERNGGLCPCPRTFVSLLQSCAKLQDSETGELIHDHVTRMGLVEKDPFIGSNLVAMYVKCGLIQRAQDVFNQNVTRKNVVSWTIMISGYVEHGLAHEALECFEKMQTLGLRPNAITFIYVLKACSYIGTSDKIQSLHADIEQKGLLQADVFIGSALVDAYAKVDLMEKAQHVFDNLHLRNVVCWNALITGYAKNNECEEVIKCYEQMRSEGNFPNSVTFSALLTTCGANIGMLCKGREIHMEVERQGRGLAISNGLVRMYSKYGLFSTALQIFDKLVTRDVITWTSLMSGYMDHAAYEEALACFKEMQVEGILPDSVAFGFSLKACGEMGSIQKGQEIHAQMEKLGLLLADNGMGNPLLDMYADCGLPSTAKHVFDGLHFRDEASWASLMSSYAKHGLCAETLECFDRMKVHGFPPNEVSFVCALKACCGLKAVERGREVHGEIVKKGLSENNPFLGSIMVDMYAKSGLLIDAEKVFDKLKVRNEISWTALILGYSEGGHCEEALKCLAEMQYQGISPDATTFVCILKACGSIGACHHGGLLLHSEIERRGFLNEESVGNALLNMYLKCGSLIKAQQVFDKLGVRDVVSWTTLMAGYVEVGKSENAFLAFDQMLGEGVEPNLITFVVLLNACSRRGLVRKGETYFESMSKDYGIAPTIEHHACIVDLLCRAGELEDAEAMIKKMPIAPNAIVWQALLGASQHWGSVDSGELAFKNVMALG